ncbi:hypothetical protein L1887_57281 [Cichorium endivia]|nr:hypothetical protein L1887_57281 [Cichorium endivia]
MATADEGLGRARANESGIHALSLSSSTTPTRRQRPCLRARLIGGVEGSQRRKSASTATSPALPEMFGREASAARSDGRGFVTSSSCKAHTRSRNRRQKRPHGS